MKASFLLLLLVSLASTVFGAIEGNIYSAPIVKRLGIREPPTVKLDRSYGNSSHERRLAVFLDKQCARHREMTLTLNEFFLTHPHLQLSVASFAVSNLNAVINSKAFVKLSKSNHNILMAYDRQRFCQQLERDLDRCYQDLSFFRDYDSNHTPDPAPVVSSVRRPLPRFTSLDNSSAHVSHSCTVSAEPITVSVSSLRRKKKNWSFLEHSIGEDLELDSLRRQEYEKQLALRSAANREKALKLYDAQMQLQAAERQLWQAEQQRLRAEQAAHDNVIPSRQGNLDSQAEISRQQQMWAEQQKRDAELRLLQMQ